MSRCNLSAMCCDALFLTHEASDASPLLASCGVPLSMRYLKADALTSCCACIQAAVTTVQAALMEPVE